MTALQVGTVYACVNIISNGVAGLPLHVYERILANGRQAKKVAPDQGLYDILHAEPNPEMTRFTFLKTMLCHDLLWGNSYAEIQRDERNQIIALWPRNPARTRPIRCLRPTMLEGTIYPAGTLMFETTESLMQSDYPSPEDHEMAIGRRRVVLAEDMLHIPGLSLDGRLGQSTVYLARQIIGLSLATEKYGAKFFGNGARPAGILTIPNKLDEIQIETLRRSWAEAHGGENQHKVAILEQGLRFEKIAATPEEGQMLGTRTFERSEICSVFNVPLHMVGAADKTGKSNIEQSSIEFVLYCLNPWLVSYEEEFGRKLFPKIGRSANRFFPKFDTRRLMYPDAAARSGFYSSGRQWGYLNANDIRELEDMNPIESAEGDKYWMPTNMQDAGDPAVLGAQATVDFHKDNPEYSPQQDHKNKLALAKASAPPVAPAPAGGATPPKTAQPAAPAKPVAPGKAGKAGKRFIENAYCAWMEIQDRDLELRQANGKPVQVLYVARHGATPLDLNKKSSGDIDESLSEEGRTAAGALRDKLQNIPLTAIHSSDLNRAEETAAIIAEPHGIKPEAHAEFRPWDLGQIAGQPRSATRDTIAHYIANPDEKIPDGESINEFRARFRPAFQRFVEEARSGKGPRLLVLHGSNVDEIGIMFNGNTEEFAMKPGGLMAVYPTGKSEFQATDLLGAKPSESEEEDVRS